MKLTKHPWFLYALSTENETREPARKQGEMLSLKKRDLNYVVQAQKNHPEDDLCTYRTIILP